MNRMRCVLLLLLVLPCRHTTKHAGVPKPPETTYGTPAVGITNIQPKKEPSVTVQKTLSNGMRVILQENHAAPVVAFQVWVNVGSADEQPGEEGLAHVFEHMLFKGTEQRGVGEIAADVEAAGGEMNAWTSFDQTVYHVVLSSREREKGVEILGDALHHSAFDQGELDKERIVILEEIKRSKDIPTRVLSQEMFSQAYQNHPYARPVLGKEEVIKGLTRDSLLSFYRKWYTPDNLIFIGVGDFNANEMVPLIEKHFASKNTQKAPAKAANSTPEQQELKVKVLFDNVQEAHAALAYPVPSVEHADIAAIDLLSVILGQGESSRLNVEVRRNQEVANDVYSYAYTPKGPGLFVVNLSFPQEKAQDALRATLFELNRLQEELVAPAELEKARAMIESDGVYQKETVQGQARKLGYFVQLVNDVEYDSKYLLAISRVTREDLRRVAKLYLQPQKLTLAALFPATPEELADDKKKKARADLFERDARAAIEDERARAQKTFAAGAAKKAPHVLHREVLDNGTVLLIENAPEVPIVSIRAVSVGGLLFENDDNNGIHSMIARMLTKGTPNFDTTQIAIEFDEMAGAIGGFTGRNSLGLRAEFLSKHFERGAAIFADCLLRPTFDAEELETERRQMLEDIKSREDNPAGEAFRLFAKTLYTKHPYRLDNGGTAESVKSFSQKQLQSFYEKHYTSERLVISIVGDIDPEKALIVARRLFGERPKSPGFVAPKVAAEPAKTATQSAFTFLDKAQAHIVLGYLGVTLSDPDRFALEVASAVLSGQGGWLFTELRDKKSLAYSVYASEVDGLSPGYFSVYLATSPERVKEAVDGITEILGRLSSQEIPAKELERAKRYLIGTNDISLQRGSAIASVISFNEVYGLGAESYKDYAKQIEAVTAQDVMRVAKKYLPVDKYTLAVVKPEKQ
jgi:zinc protease